jgi:hypothetical protein
MFSGTQHPGDGRGTVGAQHRGRGLDLQLEPQRAQGEAVRVLQSRAQRDQRRDLLGRADLRAGDDQAGRVAPRGQVRRQEQVERAHGLRPGVGLQALAPQSRERRRCPGRLRRPERRPGRGRRGVLLLVAATAVAVLEVDAQILHRLAPQLRHDPGAHVGEQVGRDAEHLDEVVPDPVRVQRGQPRRTPAGGGIGVEAIRGHVDRVHRVPAAGRARVARRERGVRRRQPPVEVAQQRCATPLAGLLAGLPHEPPSRPSR